VAAAGFQGMSDTVHLVVDNLHNLEQQDKPSGGTGCIPSALVACSCKVLMRKVRTAVASASFRDSSDMELTVDLWGNLKLQLRLLESVERLLQVVVAQCSMHGLV